MMKGGGGGTGAGFRPRPGWAMERARSGRPTSSSSFFSISFSRLVKNFTSRNFIFHSRPSPVFARHGTAGLPSPGSNSNTYVLITFFFCLQKSSGINCLCVGNCYEKSLFEEPFYNANGKCLLGESFFAYVGNGILRPQARGQRTFLRFLNTLQIVIYNII